MTNFSVRAGLGLALASALALESCKPAPEPDGLMTVPFAKGIYRIETLPFSGGHTLRLFCLEGCPAMVDVSEDHPDRPLGLVSNDKDDLFFYLSATKAGHWVRVWHLTEKGAERVGDVFSPRRPDLISDEGGHTVIRSYESDASGGKSRPVEWNYVNGRYVQSDPKAN